MSDIHTCGPKAWLANDGTERVIDAKAKEAAHRAGGATASAMAAYTIALFAHPPRPEASAAVEVDGLHPETADLVRRFAQAIAEKLADAERKYGWDTHWKSRAWMDQCREQLIAHVAKGDPRDVAAYAAFLWHHGEPTAQQPAAAHPPGTPMMPPGKFHNWLWKSLPDGVRHHAGMLTQLWATADSTEMSNALEAAVLSLAQQPAAVDEAPWQAQLADALEYFWNAACAGAGPDRSNVVGGMVEGFAAVAARLREHAAADAARQPAAAAQQPASATTMDIECRECRCGHVGINDAACGKAACSDCDWTGDEPAEDRCPGCGLDGTMCLACPKCGGLYRLLAHSEVPVEPPPAVAGSGTAGVVVEAFENYYKADHRDPAMKKEWEWWQAAWNAALAQQPAAHPDDLAVAAFAAAMKEKLAAARAKGRGGWNDGDPDMQQRLSDMLRAHVEKGDPRDVANFAMFLHQRGEAILPAQQPAAVDEPMVERAAQALWESQPTGHKMMAKAGYPIDWPSQPATIKLSYAKQARAALTAALAAQQGDRNDGQ